MTTIKELLATGILVVGITGSALAATLYYVDPDGVNTAGPPPAPVFDANTGWQTAPSANPYVNVPSESGYFAKVQQVSEGFSGESDNAAYAAVPEPGALALLGVGLLALSTVRSRKKS